MARLSLSPLTALAAATVLAVAVGGCLESPVSPLAGGSMDFVDARVHAERELERTRRAASERYVRAAANVAQARERAHRAAARGEREIALAQARVRYEAKIEDCNRFDGEHRRACRQQAQNQYGEARLLAHRIEYSYLP